MFGILFIRTPGKWFKLVGVLYPTMTLLAITITANHYIMDAIGGFFLILLSFAVVEIGFKRRLFFSKLQSLVGLLAKKQNLSFVGRGGGELDGVNVSGSLPSNGGDWASAQQRRL